jgi:hypothetical protein
MNLGGGIMLGTKRPDENNEIIITQGKARQIFLTSLGKMNLGGGIMLSTGAPADNN